MEQRKMRKLYYVFFHRSENLQVVCYCLHSTADCRLRYWMRAHIQGVLNHYNVKLRMQVVVYWRFPLWSFELRWSWMIMALRAVLCVLCPKCKCVSTSLWEIMEGVPASILQSAQNVKVKLLSIIRGVSTVNYCYLLSEPPPPTPTI